MSALLAFVRSLTSVVRWAEPWDIEGDDDPLLSRDDADLAW